MWYIVLLILLGILFLIAELVLLPGVTFGAILAMACYGGAIWYAFDTLGVTAGVVTIVIVAIVSLISIVFSLRAKTWQRFALRQEIDSTSMPKPETELSVGAVGVAVSRLSPMGKVQFGEKVYEAKSADVFIDQREQVVVVGFENFSVIVRKKS
ncbi:MAG: NfeD family protein [Alistipes sp.]|nr:NfeD family protein [Alistipes sp.]